MKQSNWQWQADDGGARTRRTSSSSMSMGCRWARWHGLGSLAEFPKMAGRKILNSSDRRVRLLLAVEVKHELVTD